MLLFLITNKLREGIFCITGQYTQHALQGMMENPSANRSEVAKKLVEAAGGKMVCFFSTPADGPGVLTIFDVPDPSAAAPVRSRW